LEEVGLPREISVAPGTETTVTVVAVVSLPDATPSP
jgi:hypothetical protein